MNENNSQKNNWVAKNLAKDEALKNLISLNAPKPIAQILAQRGIIEEVDITAYFNPNLKHLHDPFLMKGMTEAVGRISQAKVAMEGVLIYGDYDVDGTTSVALCYDFFKTHFSKIDYYIPDRYKEGYGVSKQGIDFAKMHGYTLMIVLDCGIRSVELVEYANSLGIDFIICDHHLPGTTVPNAVAVLDPKQKDCLYPYKELSGCGVGFKLIQGFCLKQNLPNSSYYHLLDLVALSIASDIVPITGENRILAYFGLKLINTNPRLGIQKIKEISINKTELSIGDLVFYIGPRINAAGRMDDAKQAVKMLLAADESEAEKYAKELQYQNTERQIVDKKITEDFKEIIEQNPALLHKKTHVFYRHDWHKGVVGIAASRAIELYYRPTIILTKSGDVLAGSARSIRGFDIHDALEKCSEHLIQFGGHPFAAGMTLLPEKLDDFRAAFEKVGEEILTEDLLTPKIYYDTEIHFSEIDQKLLKVLKRMEPFGPLNMTPVFRANNLRDDGSARAIGKTGEHLKLNIIQDGTPFPAVGFGMAALWEDIKKADTFDACFQISENYFNGVTSIQLVLKDLKITNGI